MSDLKKSGNALMIILVVLAIAVVGLILYGRGNKIETPEPSVPGTPTTGADGSFTTKGYDE